MKYKGLYFLYSDINAKEPDGIERKILSQIKSFEKAGIEIQCSVLERDKNSKWLYKRSYSDVDFIYFRKSTTIDWRFISFFRKIKENGNPIIFMEIPTYPYDGEYGNSLYSRLTLTIDHFYRRRLHSCIDRIVLTGGMDINSLWGVKTISVINGIDFASVNKQIYRPHSGVNIGCIAKFSPWHGYERIIKGLYNYYSNIHNCEVNLIMVGDGEEKNYYESLVKEYHLEEHVLFKGRLTGKKLDDVYNVIDVGACSFGRYKSKINIIGDLKSREFMAKGIPMICGCGIDVLENRKFDYALFFPNVDEPVDLFIVVEWYQSLIKNRSCEELSDIIRETAKPLIDFPVTFNKVIEEMKECLCM